MYELIKNGKVFTSKFVANRARVLWKKRINRAAVSQRSRNIALEGCYIVVWQYTLATETCAVGQRLSYLHRCISSPCPVPANIQSSAASSALGLTNTEETGVEWYGTVVAVAAISNYP